MKPNENRNGTRVNTDGRRPYFSLGMQRLSPEAAKDLLLRNSEVQDPEVSLVLELIERFKDAVGDERDLRPVRAITP
jgi:hypothetical protein